ncbi:unnamed protein product [Rotaria socialis]|uniref:Uncharacterized protein n=1 Tax=Rotaria socialis TaxID=392032 RepID=A0A820GJA9_9BILA|nr:unnamed protein product [Rotaria socialis]
MASNNNRAGENVRTPIGRSTTLTWKERVERYAANDELSGITCAVYSTRDANDFNQKTKCICGRLARLHSYEGEPKKELRKSRKWGTELAGVTPMTVYGQLSNGARFIRCDIEANPFEKLVQLILDDVDNIPKLIVSCYGGAAYFTMTDNLEREFMNGIGHLAATEGIWVLTTGLNSGVSRLIGQGIHRSKLLSNNKWKPVVIGMNSWGTLAEDTRNSLSSKGPSNQPIIVSPTIQVENGNEAKALDNYHTHFLLLDDGRVNDYLDGNGIKNYLDDRPRNTFVQIARKKTECYSVTIIVEGGFNTLEVIQNDLEDQRPVIIVHGSGRLANLLGDLLLNVEENNPVGERKIKQHLERCKELCPSTEKEQNEMIKAIEKVLKVQHRCYLSVFQLGNDMNLTNTIFKAVLNTKTEPQSQDQDRTQFKPDEPPDLLKLAVRWNCIGEDYDVFKHYENARKYYPGLFEQALKENRPIFVDYFLRRYYNPLDTVEFSINRTNGNKPIVDGNKKVCVESSIQFIIEVLYKSLTESPAKQWRLPGSIEDLEENYTRLIGPFIQSFYDEKNGWQRFKTDFSMFFSCHNYCQCVPNRVEQEQASTGHVRVSRYGEQEILRDIFLWSVYSGYVDVALVLLLQIRPRVGAALIAVGMAHHLSSICSNLQIRNTYKEHRVIYEQYATECIDACYKRNEQLACQLLLREIPLFGNITCMQIAIASRIIPFINTVCFDEVLNRQWYGQLDGASIKTVSASFNLNIQLVLFGFIAPISFPYRLADGKNETNEGYDYAQDGTAPQNKQNDANQHKNIVRDVDGIEDQLTNSEATNYWHKWMQFHKSPVVMMSYQFFFYIWFLLVFSYWMLFHMRSLSDPVHWTEIYVIVTISATLIEDIRRLTVEYQTRMLERWHKADLWMLILYAAPYLLFYIGIGIQFGSADEIDLFTAARIVLALDLEIWFLFSLRFVSAVKILGPKLFMIRNMLRDLFGIIYIIFVCITAYGVASRALVMYSNLDFTANDIAASILYPPYWFLYGAVGDKDTLDTIISSNTSSAGEIAGAKVTHVLLAFHMLFVSILILNLLIAMFNFSIMDVQEKNEYVWRYQRYELVREYFEKPSFTYPPFSLLVYIFLFIRFLKRNRQTRYRIFKRLATKTLDIQWTDFEAAATYEYARNLVENKYRSRQPPDISPDLIERMQKDIAMLGERTQHLMNGAEWMMKAIERVKMSSEARPKFETTRSSDN